MTSENQDRDHLGDGLPWTYRGVPVPYIAAWSREQAADVASEHLMTFTGHVQLRYRDERPEDRDRHRILWHRVAWSPRRGTPLFAEIHTVRQRQTMNTARCQICTAPARIWMTPRSLWDDHLATHGPGVPYPTYDPPVCSSCADLARRYCPEIGRGHLYLAPKAWAITGVRGQVADPNGDFGPPRTLDLPSATAVPDRVALRLILAKGLIATLYQPVPHADPHSVSGLGQRLDEPDDTPSPVGGQL
jgi:hypothetical protein